MSHKTMKAALVAAPLLASVVATRVGADTPKSEAELIAILQSDSAELKDKFDACRLLAQVGTDEAIAPLAALLEDEKLSHMARYALEPNPSPAVDEALRDAIGKTQGRLLIGMIASLGSRRSAESVDAIAPSLSANDPGVVFAAARALGRIGSAEAANAMLEALDGAWAANRLSICQGLLDCAETLATQGRRRGGDGRALAISIYDRLRAMQDAPHQIRAGALRGAILARREEGVALIVESLRSDDFVMALAAARAAQELPNRSVTQALAMTLEKLDADRKIVAIQTLGFLKDAEASPALLAAAKSGESAVRIEAIRALAEIGDKSIVGDIEAMQEDGDAGVAEAAKACYNYLAG